MKITTSNLPNEGYQFQSELYHPELAQFIRNETQHQEFLLKAFRFFNGILLMAMAGYLGFKVASDWVHIGKYFLNLANGIVLVFLLVIPHELLHGLAYKWVGAPKVSYGADWKKLLFFAVADGFVANYREFRLVALTPFVVISIGFLIALPLAPNSFFFTVLTMFTLHTTFCAGDFGLLNYMQRFKDHGVVTVDFKEEKKSAFWIKSPLVNE
jgi:hypothetical protein